VFALGIDTSTPRVSVALVAGEPPRLVASRDVVAANQHGEVLAASIDEVLREGRTPVTELAAIGVGIGPGPFTGLRVGMITAAAMADALAIPAYGACSLDIVGVQHSSSGPYVVVSDARRKQIYWAVYNEFGARVEGPDIGPPSDVAEHLHGRVTEVAGPASELVADAFNGCQVARPRYPDGQWLAKYAWWQQRADVATEPLTPMYLRRPDAREPGPPKKVTPA